MSSNEERRIPLCCEICLKNEIDVSSEMIKVAAQKWLFSLGITITLGRHDPSKIVCEKLKKYCDYIVIEPAIPIKIVKEYNEDFKNYKSCKTNNNSNSNDIIDIKSNDDNLENHKNIDNKDNIYNVNHIDTFDHVDNNICKKLYPSHYSVYELNRFNDLNSCDIKCSTQDNDITNNIISNSNIYDEKRKRKKITPLKIVDENKKNKSLVSSLALSQNIVHTSNFSNDLIGKEKKNIYEESNLLFTVPIIGEKSISSIEEDPIILPNFFCVVHVVTYYKNEEHMEEKFNDVSEYDEDQEQIGEKEKNDVPTYIQYILPHLRFHKLWDSLYYEENIKRDLLEYVSALMLFSTKKVDCNMINYNHLVLLYGPPGTGKTSLCKALANKVCIRLSNIYTTGILIELNTHTLFSKWFSESGKQVLKLFNKIKRMISEYEENDIFICLLIDEVESLSADRKRSIESTDPSDTVRVVNTLLTQIDSLKYYHNTLILTTSNISEMIDEAFIDRVDLKQFIGLPNEECIYEIYKNCIDELIEKEIIRLSTKIPNYERAKKLTKSYKDDDKEEYINGYTLLKCAKLSEGFSGRCLRRIPFQAYAYFCQATLRFYNCTNNNQEKVLISLEEFFIALQKAIHKETINKSKLSEQKNTKS
ncbi:AAA family ATPase, putative [Plasmodium sp. gorilla clade G1]|nr:AAA family ATPase, putative [Plasmodium sp. gorilla clade G1]